MVEHEICLLTSALNHIGYADNTGKDRLVVILKREVYLYRVRAWR